MVFLYPCVHHPLYSQEVFQTFLEEDMGAKECVGRRVVDDLKQSFSGQDSLGGRGHSSWGPDTGWLFRSETCTWSAWLYLWTSCFPCLRAFVCLQVSLENSSLLCCTEKNNVLLFTLEPGSENNTFSVGRGGKGGMGWDGGRCGGNSGYQSERSLKGRPRAHTLLHPSLCIVTRLGTRKGGKVLLT